MIRKRCYPVVLVGMLGALLVWSLMSGLLTWGDLKDKLAPLSYWGPFMLLPTWGAFHLGRIEHAVKARPFKSWLTRAFYDAARQAERPEG